MVFASADKIKRLMAVPEAVQVGSTGAEHVAHAPTAPICHMGTRFAYVIPFEYLLRITAELIISTASRQIGRWEKYAYVLPDNGAYYFSFIKEEILLSY